MPRICRRSYLQRSIDRDADRLKSILQTLLQYFGDRRHPLSLAWGTSRPCCRRCPGSLRPTLPSQAVRGPTCRSEIWQSRQGYGDEPETDPLAPQTSTMNRTGELSSESNSIPVEDRPNAATTSLTQFEEACGIAIPNPIPVLIVSSRWRKAARIESRSEVRTRFFLHQQVDQFHDCRPPFGCLHLGNDLIY